MNYTKIYTYRDGEVKEVHWGSAFVLYTNGLIDWKFSSGSGYSLDTFSLIDENLELEYVYRYAEWLYDNPSTYSQGEEAYSEDSPKVDYAEIQQNLKAIIGDAEKIDIPSYVNNEENRESCLAANGVSTEEEEYTKTMTTYEMVKKGNYIYTPAVNGLYKVNVKTGKVKKLASYGGNGYHGYGLSIYKGYLYYIENFQGQEYIKLRRINLSTGKRSTVYKGYEGDFCYAISGSKIYVNHLDDDTEIVKKEMSLSGKNKTDSDCEVEATEKVCNKSGYKMKFKSKYVSRRDEYLVKAYLKTPKRIIFVCKTYTV